jgi:uncharacterized membrane protein
MLIFLTIFQYLVQALVDLMDKFLITARKIEPISYTFYTVVTGLVLLIAWPFTYFHISAHFIGLDLLSGAVFSLAMFVFFKALSQGEASRVIPYVFGLVPVFDILISYFTGKNVLVIHEVVAVCLLIPGALLISYQKTKNWAAHLGLKTLSAFLFSAYYAVWQTAAQSGPVLNNLMWNRIGAAAVLLLPLLIPAFRKKVFAHREVKHKKSTSVIFLFKQVLGGINFIFLSFLYTIGTISIINSLQGFRYIFLLIVSSFLSKKRQHLINEEVNTKTLWQKSFGVALVFAGVIFLFI